MTKRAIGALVIGLIFMSAPILADNLVTDHPDVYQCFSIGNKYGKGREYYFENGPDLKESVRLAQQKCERDDATDCVNGGWCQLMKWMLKSSCYPKTGDNCRYWYGYQSVEKVYPKEQ